MDYYSNFKPRYGVLDLREDVINFNHRFSGLEIRTSYFNNLNYPITVGTRDGIKYDVYPQNVSELPRTFIITRTLTYNAQYVRPTLPDPKASRENQFIYDKAIKDLSTENVQKVNANQTKVITYQYTVDHNDFVNTSCYYLDDLDIVVSNRRSDVWFHPQSPDGVERYRIINNEKLNNAGSFTLDIEIITSDSTLPAKYVNINNQIFKVPITEDNMRKPGVYISYNNKTDLKNPPSPPIVDYYDLHELDKPTSGKGSTELPILFYNTIQEALIHGDLNKQREHELEQLRHSSKQMMLELEQLKIDKAQADLEREQLESERKQRMEEIKSILESRDKIREEAKKQFNDELEKERMRLQQEFKEKEHEYKMKELERKESSDIMKWIPTFLGAAISLITLYVKSSK